MKRSNFLKTILGIGTAAVMAPILMASSLPQRTDDDLLDEMVENGKAIINMKFKINRTHHFKKPCYIHQSEFMFSSNPDCAIYPADNSYITDSVFDHVGVYSKYGIRHIKLDKWPVE